MLKVTILSNLQQAAVEVSSLTKPGQLQFAAARALSMTAADIQKEVRKNMPQRFTLRRQWIVTGIRMEKATKENLTARVFTIDPFMELQEEGGIKTPKNDRYLAIPMKAVRRTAAGIIREADLPKNLGKAAFDVTRTNKKTGATSTRRLKGIEGEIMRLRFKGKLYLCRRRKIGSGEDAKSGPLEVLYLLQPRGKIKERLGLERDGKRVSEDSFAKNLQTALDGTIKTAR